MLFSEEEVAIGVSDIENSRRLGDPTETPARQVKGCLTGRPDKVATLKVRKGAFDALKKGSGAVGKVK